MIAGKESEVKMAVEIEEIGNYYHVKCSLCGRKHKTKLRRKGVVKRYDYVTCPNCATAPIDVPAGKFLTASLILGQWKGCKLVDLTPEDQAHFDKAKFLRGSAVEQVRMGKADLN